MLDERVDGIRGPVEAGSGGGGGGAGACDDWRELDRRMRRLASRRATLDAEEAKLLVAAKRAELHKHLGYGSFDEYLERVLGYRPTTGRDKVRVAEALETLPAIAAALARGKLSYSAVREITRVAKPHTDEAWADYVVGMTVREIEECVRCKEPGDHPEDRPKPDLAPRVIRMELPPAAYALFLEARRHLEREHGAAMTDADFLAMVCRDVLAGGSSEGPRANQPPHQVAITVCADCQRGWHDSPGTSVELSQAAIERARCDATELGRVDAGATLEVRASRTIPPHIRRAVLARDHHRCRVPGCTSSRYVDVHHIKHWLHGGTHDPLNLITLCGLHHDRHHDGVIHIAGDASALVIAHADGRPYGAPPPVVARRTPPVIAPRAPAGSPDRDGMVTDAKAALVKLGFKPREANDAVGRALLSLGDDRTLEQLLRASLKEAGRPRGT